jgi:broad specificity phosphatase PhoE
VELTPEGIANARRFGASLRGAGKDRNIHFLHTPAKRCRMTAMAIRDGLSPGMPEDIRIRESPEIIDPVIDLEKFRELHDYYGWHALIGRWLAGKVDEGVLWTPGQFSDELLKRVLDGQDFRPQETRIVVAHDITLFPLIHTYFRRSLTSIDYLNGIVIKTDAGKTDIGFERDILSLRRAPS